jgi:hypothetical protein
MERKPCGLLAVYRLALGGYTMTDDDDVRTLRGQQGFDAAAQVVHAAVEEVDRVGRHFKDKVDAAKRPESYLGILKDVTKAAPLGMLAVAFVGGMLFARRR